MDKVFKHFKGDGLKAQLLKGGVGASILRIVSMILGLVLSALLARNLGSENYGGYVFVISVLTLLVLPANAGLLTLIIRETARYSLQKKWGDIRRLLAFANILVITFSLVILIILPFAILIKSDMQQIHLNEFFWALLLLTLIGLGNIRTATLRGLRKVVLGQLPDQMVKPSLMVLALSGIVLFFGEKISIVTAIQINIVASIITLLISSYLLFKNLPYEVKTSLAICDVKQRIKSLLPLSSITGIYIINGEVGIILLGLIANPEDISIYRIAVYFAAVVSVGGSIFGPVIEPHITKLYLVRKIDQLNHILRLASRLSFFSSLVVLVVFYFVGKNILKVFYGDDFISAWGSVIILGLGNLFGQVMGMAGIALKQLDYEGYILKSSLMGLSLNIFLCMILIPHFGVIGAAIAFSISFIFHNFYKGIILHRVLGINSSIF